jgi:hypothetical protein
MIRGLGKWLARLVPPHGTEVYPMEQAAFRLPPALRVLPVPTVLDP